MDRGNDFCNNLNSKAYTADELCEAYIKGTEEKVICGPWGNEFKGTSGELIREWKDFNRLFRS